MPALLSRHQHPVVVLPKGFYRLSKPLRLRKQGAAIVGVGKTLSFLMPLSNTTAASWGCTGTGQPVLDVVADGVTVSHITVATWDHLPSCIYAMHWSGRDGTWRQAFFNRLTETTFPPFSAPQSGRDPSSASHLRRLPRVPRPAVLFGRPLTVITGGGAFYDYNLDFGCCFGAVAVPFYLTVDCQPFSCTCSAPTLGRVFFACSAPGCDDARSRWLTFTIVVALRRHGHATFLDRRAARHHLL